MTDRPIIFSAPMVQALLAGRKTQTRRLLRIRGHKAFSHFGVSDTRGYDWHFRDAEKRWHDLRHAELLTRLPWQVGDRLWVRENFSGERAFGAAGVPIIQWDIGSKIWYWADGNPEDGDWTKPKPSIHMPRWASRLTLTVADVRVQRLQEISEADALAEGVMSSGPLPGHEDDINAPPHMGAVENFAALWNDIHGTGAWDTNPWVVAISFTVERRNIDATKELANA